IPFHPDHPVLYPSQSLTVSHRLRQLPRTEPEMCLFGAPRALLLLCPPPPVIGKVRFQSSDYNRACALAILTTSEPAS
ncbi:hypothetical protein RRG08_038609, partial [Elysia crispata]